MCGSRICTIGGKANVARLRAKEKQAYRGGKCEDDDSQEYITIRPAELDDESGKHETQYHGDDATACCGQAHNETVFLDEPFRNDDGYDSVAAPEEAEPDKASYDVERGKRLAER